MTFGVPSAQASAFEEDAKEETAQMSGSGMGHLIDQVDAQSWSPSQPFSTSTAQSKPQKERPTKAKRPALKLELAEEDDRSSSVVETQSRNAPGLQLHTEPPFADSAEESKVAPAERESPERGSPSAASHQGE